MAAKRPQNDNPGYPRQHSRHFGCLQCMLVNSPQTPGSANEYHVTNSELVQEKNSKKGRKRCIYSNFFRLNLLKSLWEIS